MNGFFDRVSRRPIRGVFIARRWHLRLKLVYIVLYPFVVILWKVPFFILRQRSWPLAIAFINALASFFGSITYNLFVLAAFLASSSLVLFSHNKGLLWTSIVILFSLMLVAYGRRFISIFRAQKVFRIYERVAGWMPKIQKSTLNLGEKIKDIPYDQLTPEQAENWNSSLQSSFVLSRACLFAARKLRSYGKSGFGKISSAFICVFLTVATIIVFALINLGLYKIDPGFYRATETPIRFTFFHYSLNRMIFNSIPELEPANAIAKTVYDSEALFAFFLVVIFVSLLLSARTQKQIEDLNRTIEKIEAESQAMDLAIVVDFHFETVDSALAALEQRKAGTTSFLRLLSDTL